MIQSNTPLRIYISGQITGLDQKMAEEYFEAMETRVRIAGHIPVNPCKILPYSPELNWADYMVADIDALFLCDGMVMLDNWGNSNGARVEHQIALRRGMRVWYPADHHKLLGPVKASTEDIHQPINA